jgi:hypothetical protein
MRRFFSFWWECIRTAAGGNSTFANDWQWIFGNPIVSAFGTLFIAAVGGFAPSAFARLGTGEITTGMPTLDSFLGAFAAFIITWLAAFFFRLFNVPVVLFHQQKERADKLEGTPTPKPIPSDKNLAILRERYLSDTPHVERELLDYEVDGLRAVNDVTLIFNGLSSSADRLTKKMLRHNKKIPHIRDSEKKRKEVSNLATSLDFYSNETEEYTEVFRALTPALFQYTSQFIERAPATRENYIAFSEALAGNIQSTLGMIKQIHESQEIITQFRGISADLNRATTRLENVNARLIVEAGKYMDACKELELIATRKADA